MATFGLNDQSTVGYFLPEDSQFRLKKLREYVEFLSHLAQPRTANEEDEYMPDIRAGEVAICLELLAEQVELVLDEVTFPAQREARKPKTAVDEEAADALDAEDDDDDADEDDARKRASAAPEGEALRFGMTLAQLDAINRLVEMIRAHGDVASASADASFSSDTLAMVGHAIFDSAEALYMLMMQVESQTLAPHMTRPSGVREVRAAYGRERVPVSSRSKREGREAMYLH